MNTTPRPSSTGSSARPPARSSLLRGLGAAGAAVMVAFVGSAGLGAGQAQAAGIGTGLSHADPATSTERQHPSASDPAHLPSATATAIRYSYQGGRLTRL